MHLMAVHDVIENLDQEEWYQKHSQDRDLVGCSHGKPRAVSPDVDSPSIRQNSQVTNRHQDYYRKAAQAWNRARAVPGSQRPRARKEPKSVRPVHAVVRAASPDSESRTRAPGLCREGTVTVVPFTISYKRTTRTRLFPKPRKPQHR